MGYYLRIQGIVLGFIHTSFGGLAIVMSLLTDHFNTVFPMHYTESIWIDCNTLSHEKINVVNDPYLQLQIREFCNKTASDKAMSYAKNQWFDMQFGWLVAVYFLWTGIFHFLYVTLLWKRYKETIEAKERFYLRWVEYAGSAALMMFLIVYIAVFIIVGVCINVIV